MKINQLSVLASFAVLFLPARLQAATHEEPASALVTDDVRAAFEVLRSDFNATKIRTLNQVMGLTAAEAEKFWPIYRKYEQELGEIADRKLTLIREFTVQYKAGALTETGSRDLARRWLTNLQERLALWRKYHRRISNAVSSIRGAQFLQVENQMALFVDLNIASEMPVLGSPDSVSPIQLKP